MVGGAVGLLEGRADDPHLLALVEQGAQALRARRG